MKFSRKMFENWQVWKTAILKNRPFWIFFASTFENQSKFAWYNGWVKYLMSSLFFSKFLATRNIMLYSVVAQMKPCKFYFNLIFFPELKKVNLPNKKVQKSCFYIKSGSIQESHFHLCSYVSHLVIITLCSIEWISIAESEYQNKQRLPGIW